MSESERDELLSLARRAFEPSAAVQQRMKLRIEGTLAASSVAASVGTRAGRGASAESGLGPGGAGSWSWPLVGVAAFLVAAAVVLSSIGRAPGVPSGPSAPPPTRSPTSPPREPWRVGPSPSDARAVAPADPVAPVAPRATDHPPTVRRRPTQRSEEAPDSRPDPLSIELALIERAQTALARGDAPEALRALEEHALAYPAGVLRPEREVLLVQSYCAAGDTARARAIYATIRPSDSVDRTLGSSCAAPPP